MSALENDERTISDALEIMRHGKPLADRPRSIRTYANGRVSVDLHARETYSYGRHFPLFRYVPSSYRASSPGASRRRASAELFVINGDEWRGSASRTSSHQAIARRLISATGAPAVVIPFSALAGAGIDIDSIRPVDVREDKTWTETRYADVLEDVPQYLRRTYLGYDKDSGQSQYADRAPDSDGRYSWTEHMHRLGDCLFSAERAGKRARFLSSFDYQEPRPMYFLVQVPRGAGATVELAIDALAPRAVWAARARGRRVERQGDIFFVETALTEIDLYARGVTRRARLTQFDRDARPRRGEVGFVHESAKEKAARCRRFRLFRRAEFLRLHAEYFASTVGRYRDRYPWRADKRRKVREILEEIARHEDRIAQGDRWTGYAGYTADNAARGLASSRARLVAAVRESRAMRRDRAAMTSRGTRVWNTPDGTYLSDGNRARAAWSRAHELALAKYGAPDRTVARDYRDRVRRALAVYGTAHTAREVLTVKGGATYVRGRVSHRPGLVDAGRDSRAEHVPLELPQDVWFLAVRNRVPRARA